MQEYADGLILGDKDRRLLDEYQSVEPPVDRRCEADHVAGG